MKCERGAPERQKGEQVPQQVDITDVFDAQRLLGGEQQQLERRAIDPVRAPEVATAVLEDVAPSLPGEAVLYRLVPSEAVVRAGDDAERQRHTKTDRDEQRLASARAEPLHQPAPRCASTSPRPRLDVWNDSSPA
jgi:hypothetical protein